MSSGATPVVAEIVIGTNDNPRPIPSDSDTTALNLAGAGDLARRVARVNPNAVLAVVAVAQFMVVRHRAAPRPRRGAAPTRLPSLARPLTR